MQLWFAFVCVTLFYLAFVSTFKCYFNYLANDSFVWLVLFLLLYLPLLDCKEKEETVEKLLLTLGYWFGIVFPIYTNISTCWAQPNLCGWIEYKSNISTYKYLDFHFIYCYYCYYTIPTVHLKLIGPWGRRVTINKLNLEEIFERYIQNIRHFSPPKQLAFYSLHSPNQWKSIINLKTNKTQWRISFFKKKIKKFHLSLTMLINIFFLKID